MKLFVPGRICLLGEHSDWAGGYRRSDPNIEKGFAIACGTNQGVYAEVEPHPYALMLTATTPDGEKIGPVELAMDPDALLAEARAGGFWSYTAGVAYQARIHHQVGGLTINNYRTDLPVQKGLSSSAAICVLAARAFNRIYNLKLSVRGEMELAYRGETTTASRCGRMDQVCAFGDQPVLMSFDGEELDTRKIKVGAPVHMVVVDLNAQKDTREILSRLNDCFPIPQNEVHQGVHQLLGSINREVVHQAIHFLQQGDTRALGELMTRAQTQFDQYAIPACPQELTAPILHKVLGYPPIQKHIWGGKGVGSQGDGSAQFLARSEADQEAVIAILQEELGMNSLRVNLMPTRKVRKAVIPAAGYGTRLFPATKATKKELFPVIDRDGIAKPAILIIVEEAIHAGIEEVCIIVQREDLPAFEELFHAPVSDMNYWKLSPRSQDYARQILEMGKKVTFAVQERQDGFGHAVFCAKDFVGGEPFLLMLGDHIYRSRNSMLCAEQLIEAYQEREVSVVGLRATPAEIVNHFGAVSGIWIENNRLLKITQFSEKPSAAYAREKLVVPDLPPDHFLTLFGQYVLKPEIFNILETKIRTGQRESGEFQLTTALDLLRQSDGFNGWLVEGDRFDIGLPDAYLDTLVNFRMT